MSVLRGESDQIDLTLESFINGLFRIAAAQFKAALFEVSDLQRDIDRFRDASKLLGLSRGLKDFFSKLRTTDKDKKKIIACLKNFLTRPRQPEHPYDLLFQVPKSRSLRSSGLPPPPPPLPPRSSHNSLIH